MHSDSLTSGLHRHHRRRFSSPRFCLAALALCLTVALPMLGLQSVSAVEAGGPVYSIAALDAQLARVPTAWLGATGQVRAVLSQACLATTHSYPPSCAIEQLTLADPNPASTAPALPLAWDPQSTAVTGLRRTPRLRAQIPPVQTLHAGGPAVYRIKVRHGPCVQSPATVCYGAILLGAVPPYPGAYWMQG
jgi:hypothetical protein